MKPGVQSRLCSKQTVHGETRLGVCCWFGASDTAVASIREIVYILDVEVLRRGGDVRERRALPGAPGVHLGWRRARFGNLSLSFKVSSSNPMRSCSAWSCCLSDVKCGRSGSSQHLLCHGAGSLAVPPQGKKK